VFHVTMRPQDGGYDIVSRRLLFAQPYFWMTK